MDEKWDLDNLSLISEVREEKNLELIFTDNKKIILTEDEIKFENFNNLPESLLNNPYLNIKNKTNQQTIKINNGFPVSEEGHLFRGLTLEAQYFIKQKKILFLIGLAFILLIIGTYFILRKHKKGKMIILVIYIFLAAVLFLSYYKYSKVFFVSQAEVEALLHLKGYDLGNVLVADYECLQCAISNINQPAVFVNKRDFVKSFSRKNIIYDKDFVEISGVNFFKPTKVSKEKSKEYLEKLKIKYIYLTKHENYWEKVPYSPGDINGEQIFVNSNVEIWRLR